MGQVTRIAWTRSTRNFWAGCTKVGPGCDGCYAEAFQRWIRGINVVTKLAKNWGPGAPRIPHLENAVKAIKHWNGIAGKERASGKVLTKEPWPTPGFWPVFLNSHSDTFDNEVPQAWRDTLFACIEAAPNLTFQLVTKRISNVAKMVPPRWLKEGWPPNVWLLITVVNQEEADRDIPRLLSLDGISVYGLSIEPQIGEINLRPHLEVARELGREVWPIVGGESDQAGHETRPFLLSWAERIVADSLEYGFRPFVKQLGSKPQEVAYPEDVSQTEEAVWHRDGWTKIVLAESGETHWRKYYRLKDEKGGDPDEWPESLRRRMFPAMPPMGLLK